MGLNTSRKGELLLSRSVATGRWTAEVWVQENRSIGTYGETEGEAIRRAIRLLVDGYRDSFSEGAKAPGEVDR